MDGKRNKREIQSEINNQTFSTAFVNTTYIPRYIPIWTLARIGLQNEG
jgi:hypothetical protein